MSKISTPLDTDQIEANFAEIAPALSPAEAAVEANRCLYCYDAPCMHACPTHIDVPSFIKKIASGNLTGSARTVFDANPIGATCARVCPVEVLCEGACVENTRLSKPIEIGRLQRYATDHGMRSAIGRVNIPAPNGKSVGIIGSGPAGLSCAAYLARTGYDVTVYERRPLPGGLDTYGMAEYKMTRRDSVEEVKFIQRLGVRFAVNTEVVGAEGEPTIPGTAAVSFDSLRGRHDALFIATGLGPTRRLDVPGEQLEGVIDALAFIEQVKSRKWHSIPLGQNVAVIGAGNTAIDAATQAKRLGAKKVTLIYRRGESDAPAYEYELQLAKTDAIDFIWHTTVEAIEGAEYIEALSLRNAGGEVSRIPCDMLIKAIGQSKTSAFFTDVCGIEVDDAGRVIVDDSMQTSAPGVFAGGDCVNGGAEAVDAAQMGKIAAAAIHQQLFGEQIKFAGISV